MDQKEKDNNDKVFTTPSKPPPCDKQSMKKTYDFFKGFSDPLGNYIEELLKQTGDSDYTPNLNIDASPMRNQGNFDVTPQVPGPGSNNTVVWEDFGITDSPIMPDELSEMIGKPVATVTDRTSWIAGTKTAFGKEPPEDKINYNETPKTENNTASAHFTKYESHLSSRNLYNANTVALNPSQVTTRTQTLLVSEEQGTISLSPGFAQGYSDNIHCLPGIHVDTSVEQLSKKRQDGDSSTTYRTDGALQGSLMDFAQVLPQEIVMYKIKSELSSPPMPSTSSNPHFWFQTGVFDPQQKQVGYATPSGIHRGNSMLHSYPHANIGPDSRGTLGSPFISSAIPQRFCLICGDEASGCHYGVLTCGSCKVFFKRAVEGHQNYLCAGRNDCIVDKIRRKNCPACRLRKCYQAGMMLGGRKFKKFGSLKVVGGVQSPLLHSPQTLLIEDQAVIPVSCVPSVRELQYTPQILSILEGIEPEVVYADYDSSQPEAPNVLLTSLNNLCEKQLLAIVKWSKLLPGFRCLHINDQMTLIQYSWMNMMVFALGWRSYQNFNSQILYFAPDLVFNKERMKQSPIYDLCLTMQHIPQGFENLQVTREEFLCMKALLLLNTIPLEGLKSQDQFDEMRQRYIRELTKAIQLKEKGIIESSQRFYHLTKLMDSMHQIVKKLHLFCLNVFVQSQSLSVGFPEMMSEVIAAQLPKILAGMVKHILFHKK
ncbi:progesterone receptor-like [Acipenser oxyrinchus oxyrinchus]|uniref:Progesterone receptor n=1 Tax=Acipenser oxyrinchus oxyrinchus TaxID=40147 RepID=A0AAD8DI65_ACIOX|nr:progesterone receptor-like [Acipenser oxyrinchus oxyrinchus]